MLVLSDESLSDMSLPNEALLKQNSSRGDSSKEKILYSIWKGKLSQMTLSNKC